MSAYQLIGMLVSNMKKLLWIIVLGLLWCNISVAGGIKFDHFKKFRDDPSMKLYIMGLLDGTSDQCLFRG